jgi:hypothetical protein
LISKLLWNVEQILVFSLHWVWQAANTKCKHETIKNYQDMWMIYLQFNTMDFDLSELIVQINHTCT